MFKSYDMNKDLNFQRLLITSFFLRSPQLKKPIKNVGSDKQILELILSNRQGKIVSYK